VYPFLAYESVGNKLAADANVATLWDVSVKILLLHNYYQQPGGEDVVVRQEKALLEAHGHTVDLMTADNSSINGITSQAVAALSSIYSRRARRQVAERIADSRPDIVHVHNFFPQLSPSVYYACANAKVPVIQTLHNFRLICPNALLFREGKPCEDCVGRTIPWSGIRNACYRDSHVGTAVLATMLTTHRLWGTWQVVNAYIALSEFARRKLIAGGVPSSHLFVKPNCLVPDPGMRTRSGDYALFVGRLSPEKGINTLLAAWDHLPARRLKIVGDGPLRDVVEQANIPNVEFIGPQSSEAAMGLIGSAAFLVIPSECYENFPRVIVEAFAKGVPVLGSRMGSMEELIDDGRTGVLFWPGDAHDLANKAEWLFTHPEKQHCMSDEARREFETKYTAEQNYKQLMQIYGSATSVSKGRVAYATAAS
jgi:glycosyltransferase involved in cell wall biosynthesis